MRAHRPAAILAAIVVLFTHASALAGTPEAAQRAGSVHSVLAAFVIGTFGGRTLANPHFHQKRICISGDYDELQQAAKDDAALVAFHAKCRLIETKIERTHVHAMAYLPSGYCEHVKTAIEAMLAERIYSVPLDKPLHNMIVEYKNVRIDQNGAYWDFVRSSQLVAMCQDDGSLRLTGKLRKPNNRP